LWETHISPVQTQACLKSSGLRQIGQKGGRVSWWLYQRLLNYNYFVFCLLGVLLKIEITIQFCRIQKVQEPFFSVSTEFLAMAFPTKAAKGA